MIAWLKRITSRLMAALEMRRHDAAHASSLFICYGSQTGNAETLAKGIHQNLHRHFRKTGNQTQVKLLGLDSFHHINWLEDAKVLFVTSTTGQGELPDQAQRFWRWLTGNDAPTLHRLRFAVLGLGDSRYPDFCGGPRQLEQRLASLGAQPLLPLWACDADYHVTAQHWLRTIAALFASSAPPELALTQPPQAPAANELRLRRTALQQLTAPNAQHAVFHLELEAESGTPTYAPGDGLAVFARNDSALVDAVLARLQYPASASITVAGETHSLHSWLSERRAFFPLSKAVLPVLAAATTQATEKAHLCRYLDYAAEGEHYLATRDVLDVLSDFPACAPEPAALLAVLPPLAPRTYSLASAPTVDGAVLHLTVAAKTTEVHGRVRYGAASGFLCGLLSGTTHLRAFVQKAPHFHLPDDTRAPILMIAAGTGIAPFRGFLRALQQAQVMRPLWLVFGIRRQDEDALYREELNALQAAGMCRVIMALSRESSGQYVQDVLLDHADTVWQWLENGGHMYVCGSTAMGAGVEQALQEIIHQAAGLKDNAAQAWFDTLRDTGRYHKDVY